MDKKSKPHTYDAWILTDRAPDVEGQWYGHCLEFDVVSVGSSPDEATRMTMEAVRMLLEDDLEHGRDPAGRRAPAEFWTPLDAILGAPRILTSADVTSGEFCPMACRASFVVGAAPLSSHTIDTWSKSTPPRKRTAGR